MLMFVCTALLLVISSVQAQSPVSNQKSNGLCFPGPSHKRNLAVLDETSPSQLEGEGLLTLVNVLKDTIRGVEKNENSIQMMLQNMAQIFRPKEKREICDIQDCEGLNNTTTDEPLQPNKPNDDPGNSNNPDEPPGNSDSTTTTPPGNSDSTTTTPPGKPDPNNPIDPGNSDPNASPPPGNPGSEDTTTPENSDRPPPGGSNVPPNKDNNQPEDIFVIVETQDRPEEDDILDVQNTDQIKDYEILNSEPPKEISTTPPTGKSPTIDNNKFVVNAHKDSFIIVETDSKERQTQNKHSLIEKISIPEENNNENETEFENDVEYLEESESKVESVTIQHDKDKVPEDAFIIVETVDLRNDSRSETEYLKESEESLNIEDDSETVRPSDDAFLIVETDEEKKRTEKETEYLDQTNINIGSETDAKENPAENEKEVHILSEINNERANENQTNAAFIIVETDEKGKQTENEIEPREKETDNNLIIVETDEKGSETEYLEGSESKHIPITNDPFNIVEQNWDSKPHQKLESEIEYLEESESKHLSKTNYPLNIIERNLDTEPYQTLETRKIIKIPGKAYVIVETKDNFEKENQAVEERNENLFSTFFERGGDRNPHSLKVQENNKYITVDKSDEKQKQLDLNFLKMEKQQRNLEQPSHLSRKNLKIIRTVENNRFGDDEMWSQTRPDMQGREIWSQIKPSLQGLKLVRGPLERDQHRKVNSSPFQGKIMKSLVPSKRLKIIRTKDVATLPQAHRERRTGIKKEEFNIPYKNGYYDVWQKLEHSSRKGN